MEEVNLHKNSCIVCYEPITNPICRKCYIKQIGAWIKDLGLNSMETKITLNQVKKDVPKLTVPSSNCILCQKENISLCSYCLFLKATHTLQKMNFPDNLINQFLEIFNYQNWDSAYVLA